MDPWAKKDRKHWVQDLEVHIESPAIDPKQVGDVKALLKEAKRPVILLQSQVNSRIERVHGVIIIKGLLNQDTHIMYHQHNITFSDMGGITVRL